MSDEHLHKTQILYSPNFEKHVIELAKTLGCTREKAVEVIVDSGIAPGLRYPATEEQKANGITMCLHFYTQEEWTSMVTEHVWNHLQELGLLVDGAQMTNLKEAQIKLH